MQELNFKKDYFVLNLNLKANTFYLSEILLAAKCNCKRKYVILKFFVKFARQAQLWENL